MLSSRFLSLASFCLIAPLAEVAIGAPCGDLPNPVYVPGTTDVKPFLALVAPKLGGAGADEPITIVYQALGSCTAVDLLLSDTPLQGTAVYWAQDDDGNGEERTCELEGDVRTSLALSDVTVDTCTGASPPEGFAEFSSMVQPFGFVVPSSSSQEAITATEARYLFEFGGEAGNQVPPWTNPDFIVIRNPASSTQLLIGLEAGVPGTSWSANLTNDAGGSSGVVQQVAAQNNTGNAEETLGILSLQRYDQVRDEIRMLAFEAFGQDCLGAVYPDSTPTSFDKQNVRDGHYAIWGYLWAMAATSEDGTPLDPLAARFIEFLEGSTAVNGADPIADAARAGAIPACAMTVRREYDGAPMQSYAPEEPCGCYYESVVEGETECTSCETDEDCSDDTRCSFGFCEAG